MSQQANAVAIGFEAGNDTQGANAVAIGYRAGATSQHENTVIINATGADLDSDRANALFMAPMRFLPLETTSNVVTYNPATGEVTQSELISNSFDLQNVCDRGNTYTNTMVVGNLVAQNNVEAIQFLGNAAHLVSTTNVQDGNYGDTDNVVAITITDGRITALTNVASNIEDLQNTCEQGNTYDSTITAGNLVATHNVEAVQFLGNAAHLVVLTNVQDGNYGDDKNVVAITITDGRITALTNTAGYLQDLQNVGEQGNVYDSTMTVGNLVATHNVEAVQFLGNASHLVSTTNVQDGNYGDDKNVVAIMITDGRITALTNTAGYLQDLQNVGEQGNVYDSTITVGNLVATHNVEAIQFLGNAAHLVSTTNVADGSYGDLNNMVAITVLDGRISALTNTPGYLQDLQNVSEQGNVYDSTMTVGNLMATHNVQAVQFLGNASHLVSTTNVADGSYGDLNNVVAVTILDGRITTLTNTHGYLQDLQNTSEQGNTYDPAIQLTSTGNNLVLGGMIHMLPVVVGSGKSASTQVPDNAVCIGKRSTDVGQGASSVSIGTDAGETGLGNKAVAIGQEAGEENAGLDSVNIGYRAARFGGGARAVSVGAEAGRGGRQNDTVAVGYRAGMVSQFSSSVAVGSYAGQTSQGARALALGVAAGSTGQHSGSIAINAGTGSLDTTGAEQFHIKPIRYADGTDLANVYDSTMTVGNLVATHNVEAVQFLGNASPEVQELHNVVDQGNITTLIAEFMNTENAIKTNLISNVIIDPNQLNNVSIDYATIGEKHALVWDGDNWVNHFPEEIVTETLADVAISKGQAVYVSDGSGATPEISPADPTDPAKMPSIGVALENGSPGDSIHVCTKGVINVQLPGMTVGNTVYVSNTSPGDLMDFRPAGDTDLVQNIGIVIKDGNGGKLLVTGVGRTNDVPNTTTNSMKDLDITGIYVQDTGNVITKIGFESLAQMVTTKEEASVDVALGELVYVDGVNAGMPTVSLAMSDSTTTCPYAGFMCEALTAGEVGRMATHGVIITDTGAFSDGAQVWLSNTVPGGMMNESPDYVDTDLIQSVGFVIDAATQGRLLLINPGRVTAVPNTTLQLPGAITANGVYVEDLATGDFTRIPVSDLGQDLQNVCETGNVYNSAITVTNVLTTNVVSTNVSGNGSGLTSTTDVADDTYGGLGNVAAITILDGRVTQIQNVEAPMLLQDLQNTSEQGNTYDSAIQLTSTGNNQGNGSVAIGLQAGQVGQSSDSIAIGFQAAAASQGFRSIALGRNAGQSTQGQDSIASGYLADTSTQGSQALAIGANCQRVCNIGLQPDRVAIGFQAGESNQVSRSIAIGYRAGHNGMGAGSIVLGSQAGGTSMGANSTFFSAAGGSRQFQNNDAFGVTPMNSTAVGGTQGNIMHYDPTTYEIRYDTAKTFVIPHPNRPGRMLVHGCLEGPEGGVYYRGKGNSSKPVRLPDYVPDLIMDEPTIHVTPIGNNQTLGVSEWNRATNSFRVIADRPTDFHWTFTAMRVPVNVEPFETEVEVKGQGPYTYIAPVNENL